MANKGNTFTFKKASGDTTNLSKKYSSFTGSKNDQKRSKSVANRQKAAKALTVIGVNRPYPEFDTKGRKVPDSFLGDFGGNTRLQMLKQTMNYL